MKKILCIILTAVMLICLTACGRNSQQDDEERTAIIGVVEKGIQALNDEDAEAYLETCRITEDEENGKTNEDVLEEKRQSVLEVFTWFDLEYTVDDIAIKYIDGDTAVVVVKQSVHDNKENTIFEDKKQTLEITLIKIDGVWLVSGSEEV